MKNGFAVKNNGIRIALFSLLLILQLSVIAAPKKVLWPRWQVNNANSKKTIDYHLYQGFLNKYMYKRQDGINFIHYSKVTASDKAQLAIFLQLMSRIKIDQYNRGVQLAYWINLYNALTLKTVLDYYPVKSIRDIKLSGFFGLFSQGPWNAKLIRVNRTALSLNDIEHRIIRPIWNDPRTHYALNCASYSCPNLQKNVFRGARIKTRLNEAAKMYVNSPRGVTVNGQGLIVSKIYQWYQSDFGGTDAAVIAHLKHFAKPGLKKQLNAFHSVSAYVYNWSLNGN